MTSGCVASVAMPLGKTQRRTKEDTEVNGLKPVKNIANAKKKGPYQNSLVEGNMHEADLHEDDLIFMPGQGNRLRPGFFKHDPDKAENEGETLKNSLHTIIRVATHLNKELSTRDNFPEWVSEKIGMIKSNMVNVMDYLISAKEMHKDIETMETLGAGVIAGGMANENKELSKKEVIDYFISRGKTAAQGASAYERGYRGPKRTNKPTTNKPTNQKYWWHDKDEQDIAENNLNEKAVSKAQQRFMGMVNAVKKGEMKAPSNAVRQAARGMTKKAAHDYAATKHKGLPEKVKKDK